MNFLPQPRFAVLASLAVWLTAGWSAFAADDAGAMFKAYTNAFYVSDGTNGYFKDDQSGGAADFWRQAEEIECVLDACERTSNADYRVMAVALLNGFAKDHGTNWSTNHFNDDCMWASIAFARGRLISGDTRFGDIACWNFDLVYARAWDTNLNGGLYWTTDNHSKNACVNGPAGIAACLLHQIYGEAGYLDKARDIFAWERAVLFDPDTGAVSDNISLPGTVHHWASTYNQGTFIGLANFLGQTNDAALAADFTRDHLTDSGILAQYGPDGNNSGFNAIFLRWMTRFMRDRGLQGAYESWLRTNAAAAWKVRRTADGLSWCQWQQPTPATKNLHSWDCLASLEAVQMMSSFSVQTADGKCEITIDTAAAPELQGWAENDLAPVLAAWYPKIVALLPSGGFIAPTHFRVTLKPGDGVAYTSGTEVVANSSWLGTELHGQAVGSLVHEMVHVVQRFNGYNPGWLVEGSADYIRWFKYEPQSHGADLVWFRKHGKKFSPNYNDSYRVSANFLNWVTEKYDPDIVTQLNAAMRRDRYDDNLWEKYTGKTVRQLGAEWKQEITAQLEH